MKKRFRRGLSVLLVAALTLGSLSITADTVEAAETVGIEESAGAQLPEVEDTADSTGKVAIGEYGLPIFSGKIKNPTLIREDNYAAYGFTEENYTSYLGYAAITCADEMFCFSTLVKNGDVGANGVLINDIDLAGTDWIPIGLDYRSYTGTFDGQGHRIYNLFINTTEEEQGLFGNCDSATIRNIVLDKSCSITGGSKVGGFVGNLHTQSTLFTITNCVNEATVTGDSKVGGIIGSVRFGYSANVKITNCYNTGTITGRGTQEQKPDGYSAAIVGYGSSGTTVTNCYNIGTVVGAVSGSSFAGSNLSTHLCVLQNCYQPEGFEAQENVTNYTSKEASDGTLCYLLNEQKEEGNVWYQKLGEETLPNLVAAEDRKVYAEYEHGSDTPKAYHNTKTGHTVPNAEQGHNASIGTDLKCSVCGVSAPFIFTAEDIEVNVDYAEPIILSAESIVADSATVTDAGWYQVTTDGTEETLAKLSDVSDLSDIKYEIPVGQPAGVYTYALTASSSDGSYTYRKDIKVTISKLVLTAEDFQVTLPDPENLYYSGNVKTAVSELKSPLTGVGTITVKYKKDNEGKLLSTADQAGTYQVYTVVSESDWYLAAELDMGVSFTIIAEEIIKTTPTQVTEENYKEYKFTEDNYSDYIGYYAITSAEELFGFAELVNSGADKSVNGVMTCDITIPDHQYWIPIGLKSKGYYCGVFDGLGHTISNLKIDTQEDYQGFVGTSSTGCVIRNLMLDETCSISGDFYVGAFIGAVYDNNTTVENCASKAYVSGDAAVSAMIGKSFSDSETVCVINCYNAGQLAGVSPYDSFSDDYTTCINCYELDDIGLEAEEQEGVTIITRESEASGELCYLLNGKKSGETTWYQKLGTDGEDLPNLYADENKLVYAEYEAHGSDTVKAYSNAAANHTTPNSEKQHDDYIGADFKCSECQLETAIYMTSEEQDKKAELEYTSSEAVLAADIVLAEGASLRSAVWYEISEDTQELTQVKVVENLTELENLQYQIETDKGLGTYRYALIATEDMSGYECRKDFTFTVGRRSLAATDFQVSYDENPYYSGNNKNAVVKLAAELDGIGEFTVKYKKDNTGELLDEIIEIGKYRVYAVVTEGTRYTAAVIDTGTDVEIIELDVAKIPEKVTSQNYEDYQFTDETGSKYIGYYAITTAEEMYGFAELVNSGEDRAAKGVMTCDIEIPEGYYWTPIGQKENAFSGIFDGQGHTISNLIIDTKSDNQALVGYGTTETMVCNVTLDETCAITGRYYVAGFIANISQESSINKCTIENCGNRANITGVSSVAGIFGSVEGGVYEEILIQSCYNTGTITNSIGSRYGAICAYERYLCLTVNDSYNTGTIIANGKIVTGKFVWRSATYSNCYQLDTCGTQNQIKSFTSDEMVNGKLCYMLNGSKSGESFWYQKLGENQDALPTRVASADRLVYAEYAHGSDEVVNYANTAKNHTAPNSEKSHNDYFTEEFKCSECGLEQALYISADDKDVDYDYQETVLLQASIHLGSGSTLASASWYEVTNGVLGNEQAVTDLSNVENLQYEVPTGKPAGIYTYALVAKTEAGDSFQKNIIFTVNKLKLTIEDFEVTLPTNLTYSGVAIHATVTANLEYSTYSSAYAKYTKDDSTEIINSPIEPGTYHVYVCLSESNIYQSVLIDYGISFTIVPATEPKKKVPEQITESNYSLYGFTPDEYTDYLGYYAISSSEEMFGFAELVNGEEGVGGNQNLNCAIVEDITLEDGQHWVPLGDYYGYPYRGTIDGRGHTISNLIIHTKNLAEGLVGYAGGGIVICNLTLDETCAIRGDYYVGGFIGSGFHEGLYTLKNCVNRARITVSAYGGGFVGSLGGGEFYFENCYNTGTITGTSNTGLSSGGSDAATFVNCYNIGDVRDSKPYASFARGGTYINCYQLESIGIQKGISIITEEDVTSGALCYLLNGSKQAGDTWYQKLGDDADAIPVTVAAEDKLVYAEFKHGDDEVIAYHNTQTGHTLSVYEEAHNDYVGTDLICSKCKEQLPIGITVNDTRLPYSDLRTGRLLPEIGVKEGTSITSAVWYEVDGNSKTKVADVTDTADKAYEVPAGKALGTYTYLLELTSSEDDFTVEKSMSLTITNGELTADDLTVTLPADVKYNQSAKTATVSAKSGVTGMGEIAVKYKKDNKGTLLDTAVNVGTYQVYAVVAAGSNYNAATIDTGESFTISYLAAPTAVLYNGKSKASSYATTESVAVSAAGYTVSDKTESGFASSYTLTSTKSATVTKTLYFKDSAGNISDGTVVSVVFQAPAAVEKPTAAVQLPKKGTTVKVGKAYYKVTVSSKTKGTVTYVKPTSKTLTSVVIPETVKIKGVTFKVTAIAANACKSNTKLAKVTIGKNVKTIGKNAFLGCKKLKKITVKSASLTTKSVGSNAFKNIYAKAVISVPKAKVKAYTTLLKKKGIGKNCKVKKA